MDSDRSRLRKSILFVFKASITTQPSQIFNSHPLLSLYAPLSHFHLSLIFPLFLLTLRSCALSPYHVPSLLLHSHFHFFHSLHPPLSSFFPLPLSPGGPHSRPTLHLLTLSRDTKHHTHYTFFPH